jgi:hypothetical protein
MAQETGNESIIARQGNASQGIEEVLDQIAAGLYNLASMLVGEGEEGVRLVETAIEASDVSCCADPVRARANSRLALCQQAIATIARLEPGSLAAPGDVATAATCIQDDDLESAGLSPEELNRMIAGGDRDRVRQWLEGLSTPVRVIFVLRAVAGVSAIETAELLAAHAGADAAGWNEVGVRDYFRRGLCSLASQLIQASAGR